MNFRTLITGAVVGILVYGGAYFFMPPPQEAYSCSRSTVVSAISYCLDGATISGGRISTYC